MTKWWIKVALFAGWMAAAAPAWSQPYPGAALGVPAQEPMPVAPPAGTPGLGAPMMSPGMPQMGPGMPMMGPGMPMMGPGMPPMGPGMPMMRPGMPPMGMGPGMPMMGPGMPPPGMGPGMPMMPPPIAPDGSEAEPDNGFGPPPSNCRPTAFTGEEKHGWDQAKFYLDGCGYYATVGALGLQRSRPGRSPFIVVDPQNLDTGTPPPPGQPVAQDLHDLIPEMRAGVQAEFGWYWDWGCVEVDGFYVPPTEATVSAALTGQLDLPFFNMPLGFEGDNGMWLQADHVVTSLRTELGNAEVNFHIWKPGFTGLNGFVGLRYLDDQERFRIATDDDSFALNGLAVPSLRAIYTIRTHNQIVAPQLGFEYQMPVLPWLAFSAKGKGAWGANFARSDFLLQRGDGFLGINDHRDATLFSQVYELGAYLDMYFYKSFHLRAGYLTMWAVDVQEATGQLSFDLSQTTGTRNDSGNIFYHGPTLELQIVY